jgi:hypothetical protein
MKILGLVIIILIMSVMFACDDNKAPTSTGSLVWLNQDSKEFHRHSCQYVGSHSYSMTKSQAVKTGFTPCPVCKP